MRRLSIWWKWCENESDPEDPAEPAGGPGAHEGPGTAQGADYRADALDNRERLPLPCGLGMVMGFPGKSRPASTQHADTDAHRGVVHSGDWVHREIADRRGPERNPGRVAE